MIICVANWWYVFQQTCFTDGFTLFSSICSISDRHFLDSNLDLKMLENMVPGPSVTMLTIYIMRYFVHGIIYYLFPMIYVLFLSILVGLQLSVWSLIMWVFFNHWPQGQGQDPKMIKVDDIKKGLDRKDFFRDDTKMINVPCTDQHLLC